MYKFKLFYLVFVIVFLKFDNCLCKWKAWNEPLDWWQTTTLYQIYPRSFQDSDGDGIGDLKGIEQRLNHLNETGIKSIWLSPIFKSPMADLGYDISNFTDIDSVFGTFDDFKSLIKAVKERDMYLLMDLVPNHTSDEHPWFQKSIQRIKPYTDYYMWKDPKILPNGSIAEPNNWLSLFGGSGWTYNETRKQYYYHQFNEKQPELNLSNANVQEELKNVMKFWLDLGVDGFRVDAVKHFMEDPEFRNESCYPIFEKECDTYNKMIHNYTTDWPTTYDLIYDWRQFLDEYRENSSSKHTRVMLTEAYTTMDYLMKYYGNSTHLGAHSPFNFFLVWWPNYASNSSEYKRMINTYYDSMPEGTWGNWVSGNHDNHRVATRVGTEMVDAFYMLSMLLPGTAVTYQGEEIGQPDTAIREDQIKDPNNNGGGAVDVRDAERGPFLWDSSENAGFTTKMKPWEPIHPSYWYLNLEAQKKAEKSHYKIYKQIIKLRDTVTVQRGDLNLYNMSTWIFAFTRTLPGNESYIVVLNVGSEMEVVILGEHIPKLPNSLYVIVSSINSDYSVGEIIDTKLSSGKIKPLVLKPKESVVLSTILPNGVKVKNSAPDVIKLNLFTLPFYLLLLVSFNKIVS